MPKRDMRCISAKERIALDALIDEAANKCGSDAVNNVLKACRATRIEAIDSDDYWNVVSELQLLSSDS